MGQFELNKVSEGGRNYRLQISWRGEQLFLKDWIMTITRLPLRMKIPKLIERGSGFLPTGTLSTRQTVFFKGIAVSVDSSIHGTKIWKKGQSFRYHS
jgi:hypothetical protein